MSVTLERVRSVLARPPDLSEAGADAWGGVTSEEALAICECHYANGSTPDDVREWMKTYPSEIFWWSILRDY